MFLPYKLVKSSYLFVLLPVLLLSGFYIINNTFTDSDFSLSNVAEAQIMPQLNPIEILSTSSYVDDLGSFHIVGEVNNTSLETLTDVVTGILLYNLTTNKLVGNYSAFTSLEILRSGELSPFHIVVDDPQVLGNFDFIEFYTSSKEGQEKPPNLVVNVTNRYVEEAGNPHIAGNVVNQGYFPESFANLIATYYDNSSQGVIGTETFGVDLGNISQGQLAWFDLGIADNRTKNQAQFFALSVESNTSSMDYPLNTKRPLLTTGALDDAATSTLFGDQFLGQDQIPFSTASSNTGSRSGSSNDDISSSSENHDLNIEIEIEKDPLVRGNDQTIEVVVTDSGTKDNIAGADIELEVFYTTDYDESYIGQTNNDGQVIFQLEIGPNSDPGIFDVVIEANADGYESETERTSFEVIPKEENDNDESETEDNNQRGEYLVDASGNHYYNVDNCSEEPGSSGRGNLSECEDAERETKEEEGIQEPLEDNPESNAEIPTLLNQNDEEIRNDNDDSERNDDTNDEGNSNDRSNNNDDNEDDGNDDTNGENSENENENED